jgi:hypothetical protein
VSGLRPRALTTAAVLAFGLLAAPGSPAAASTCSGSGHDAANPVGDKTAEIDVTCDTAINSGKVTVRVNRGGDVAANPTIVNGSGSLSCAGQNQPPGSPFQLVISCNGSMTANATAQITASFGPNQCSSPLLSGDLSAEFGDGTSFGPAPLGAYNCGSNTGGGGTCTPGRNCDPGGVFQGDTRKPPSKARVSAAKKGLKFILKLGVEGKVTTTIEVKGKIVGKTTHSARNGNTNLVAKLGSKAAKALAGKTTKAVIHVHVVPAASEGFTTPGERYFRLKLTR